MTNNDIESVRWNIEFIDRILAEIDDFESKITELEEKKMEYRRKLSDLESFRVREAAYKTIGQNTDIKLTLNQILDEIARELETSRGNIYIKFNIVAWKEGNSPHRAPGKKETIEWYSKTHNGITVRFQLALDLRNLKTYNTYGYTEEEKERWKTEDPLFREYHYHRFKAKPYELQSDGRHFIDHLTTITGHVEDMSWKVMESTLEIDEAYGSLYYHISAKYVDLDSDDYFSKAIKRLLNEEELKQYYAEKKELEDFEKKREEEIRNVKRLILAIEESIRKLDAEINEREKQIKSIRWPQITIRLGDFVNEIFKADNNPLSLTNTRVVVLGGMNREVEPDEKSRFTLSIQKLEPKSPCPQRALLISWDMSYSDIMYDGRRLYDHFRSNFDLLKYIKGNFFKTTWEEFYRVKDFMLTFNPIYFFRRGYSMHKRRTNHIHADGLLDDKTLKIGTIREAAINSMEKQKKREIGYTKKK